MIDIRDSWYRVSIKAIIYNEEGKILLCKEENWVWDLPGWWLEHSEEVKECLKRELKEEMWVEIIDISSKPLCFITFHKSYSKKRPWISNICYEVKVKNLNFVKSNECIDIWFFDKKDIENMYIIWNVEEVFNELL